MTPGTDYTHHGITWRVEKIELRGWPPDVTHWAKLVCTEGLGKTARLINVEWIEIPRGGNEDE